MIKSTLRFDDVGVVPGLLPLIRAVQRSHMWSRKRSERRPGNEANVCVHVCEGVRLLVGTYVTGSVKRDLNSLFKMRVLQRSVFPQHFAQSKSNMGVLRRRRYCTIRVVQGGVHGICDRGEFFKKWHYYEGAYLQKGGSFRLLVWDGIS